MKKDKRVVYYLGSGQWDGSDIQVEKMTTINIAFVTIGEDGALKMRGDHVEKWETEYFAKLDEFKKRNPNLKINLSAGGWGATGFSEMAKAKNGRKKFIGGFLEYLEKYNLDGADLDWEYPVVDGNDVEQGFNKNKKIIDWKNPIKTRPYDRENFTVLIEELREALDRLGKKTKKYYEISFAAAAMPEYLDWIEAEKLAKLVDFVKLMTYDYYTIWNATTGHHANIYNVECDLEGMSADKSVKNFLKAGFTENQIVLGAPFYGRGWQLEEESQSSGIYEKFKGFVGAPSYHEIIDMVEKDGFTRYWDDVAKSPSVRKGKIVYSYEDKESLSEKIKYLHEKNLRGIMVWEYTLDITKELVDHIDKEMKKF